MAQSFLVLVSVSLIVLALKNLNDLAKAIWSDGFRADRPQWWIRGAECVLAGIAGFVTSTIFVDPYSWWIFLSLVAIVMWAETSFYFSRSMWRAQTYSPLGHRIFWSGAIAAIVAAFIALPFQGFQATGWFSALAVTLGLLPFLTRRLAKWSRSRTNKTLPNMVAIGVLAFAGWFVIFATTKAFQRAGDMKVVKMVKRATARPTPKPTIKLPKWVMGKGMHVWQLDKCVERFGSLEKIVDKMKWAGIDHLFVKTCDAKLHLRYPKTGDWMPWADGEGDIRPQIKRLTTIAHNQGIKVYCWSFVYGEEPTVEAQLAIETLDLGVDGFFYDVEDDFRGRTKAAETMCSLVSKHTEGMESDPLIGFTSNDNPSVHPQVPWLVFDKYCEVYAPQTYWRDDPHVTPDDRINWAYNSWNKYQKEVLIPSGGGRSFDHIIPVGHAYDHELNSRCSTIKYDEIIQFGEEVKNYWGIQWYVLDYMGEAQLEGIRDSAGGLEEKIIRWQDQEKKKIEK